MSAVAWVDPVGGVAGDMFLGALVDAGLDVRVLEEVVAALRLEDVTIEAHAVRRGALAATKVDVRVAGQSPDADPGHLAEAGAPHRAVGELLETIRRAEALPSSVRGEAVRVFETLARAEARVHGTSPEHVHFHEVGAADALLDVVGTCAGLAALGATTLRVGALPWTSGWVETAHGRLPLPPPAVAHLLVGHPTWPSEERRELVTPTGAAIVAALSRGATPPPGFVPRAIGSGAGTHDGGPVPNVLRLVLGEVTSTAEAGDAVLLETNLDDATGQEVARAIERALGAGALDAWATPVTMKKGRPGVLLSLLVRPDAVPFMEALVLTETPTLGVRRSPVSRSVLPRRHVTVKTPWGEVRVKVRETPSGPRATPEHDDARALAERHGVPLRDVLEAARSAWPGT